jgi:hypothetical protein
MWIDPRVGLTARTGNNRHDDNTGRR